MTMTDDDRERVPVDVSPEDAADLKAIDRAFVALFDRDDNDPALAVLADRFVAGLGTLISYMSAGDLKRFDEVLPKMLAMVEREARNAFEYVATELAQEQAKGATKQ